LLYDVSCYATRVSALLASDRLVFIVIPYWLCWRQGQAVTVESMMKVTLDALGQMFQSARGIMAWLGDCAKVYNHIVCWNMIFPLIGIQF
jgi:hypothetical protein